MGSFPANIPTKSRFNPKDDKEILHHLFKKVKGEQLTYYYNVVTCDLYNEEEPWKKEFNNITHEDEDTLYFITKLKKNTEKGRSPPIGRTIGGGYAKWKAYCDMPMTIKKGMEIIGTVQNFAYVKERSLTKNCERWVMSEYRLGNIYKEFTNLDDYVMCKIRKENVPQVTTWRYIGQQNSTRVLEIYDPNSTLAPDVPLQKWEEVGAEFPDWISSMEASSKEQPSLH